MPQTIQNALKNARFYTDEHHYTCIQLPSSAITAAAGIVAEIGEPFCCLIADKDEVTLLLPTSAVSDFAQRMPGYYASNINYRLITIDVMLEPDLVGFMAVVSRALADQNISILAYAAFSRDHIFVDESQLDQALAALEALKAKINA
jgi:hypothetical protein